MIEVREGAGRVTFLVRIQPRAGRSELAGVWQGALRVRLAAPPVEDRANDALRHFLASQLRVPIAAVKIVAGKHSRNKRLEISGVRPERVVALAASSVGPTSSEKRSHAAD